MRAHLWQWQFGAAGIGERLALDTAPIAFSDIPGWTADDQSAAFCAFRRSSDRLNAVTGSDARTATSRDATLRLGAAPSPDGARRFFEDNFRAYLVAPQPKGAIVTGYFEPELAGSLEPVHPFTVPVHAMPDDLVLIPEGGRPDALAEDLTAARAAPEGMVPYYTRQEIEEGALSGRGLEIAYLADRADAFVMHVQGSGLIRLPDGRSLRIGFAGKNGHPYSSIGKLLVERGELAPANASLEAVLGWMRADARRGQLLMWENRSYIFFRVLDETEAATGAHGAFGVPLTPGRSLAVDPRYHRLGLPIWVSAPSLKTADGIPFNRLMIAQDTGSAIRGPVRGDIFWGTGAEAGRIAGETNQPCDFCILIPN
jgi:membrane-bound lytic murein transglycosylase A